MLAGCSLFAENTCSGRIRCKRYRHWWHSTGTVTVAPPNR